jgi:hypothetical protein
MSWLSIRPRRAKEFIAGADAVDVLVGLYGVWALQSRRRANAW